MKAWVLLLVNATLGGLLLTGCLPSYGVSVDYGYGYPSRRVTVRRPLPPPYYGPRYRTQTLPRGIYGPSYHPSYNHGYGQRSGQIHGQVRVQIQTQGSGHGSSYGQGHGYGHSQGQGYGHGNGRSGHR